MAIDKTLNPYATAATQLGGVNPNGRFSIK